MTPLPRWLALTPGWAAWALCALAGALIPLALAPFDLWPLAPLALLVFVLMLDGQSAGRALGRALAFGLGLYGAGASWVYVSIHTYGNAPAPLAGAMTGLFVAFMALVFSLPFWAYGRWFGRHPLGPLLAFPALYLLGEWLRSWLLTGFPWLYVGYSQMSSPLAGWAPVVGVLGVGLILTLSSALAGHWLLRSGRNAVRRWTLTLALLSLWPLGWALGTVEWTEPQGEPVSVGMIQPDIPQDRKWDPAFFEPTLERLERLSEGLWDNDWLIWPEAAIPRVYHEMLPYLDQLNRRAEETQTGLVTGIIFDRPGEGLFHNSLVGLGPALGIYHKRRLVPFGEYVPLEPWLRGLIDFFDLPTSFIHRGPWDQGGLSINGIGLAPLVCYEIAYPDLVARTARDSQVLLTVSNDAWFADTIGPLQHMQIARMRALETARPMIRATNNGVSALVDHRGRITGRAEQFVQTSLKGELQPRQGLTPFMRWGSWPVVGLCLLLLVGAGVSRQTAFPGNRSTEERE